MFSARYFAPRWFAPRFFAPVGADSPPPATGNGYFASNYFSPRYFAPRWFPAAATATGPSATIAVTLPNLLFAVSGSPIVAVDIAWTQPAPTWAVASALAADIAFSLAAPTFAITGYGGSASAAISFSMPALTFALNATVSTGSIWTPVGTTTTTWTPV